MGGYRLCQIGMAKKPYFIENISTNAFSIEEICYFMYANPVLLDGSIVNRELCTWFAEELKLERLAQTMERALEDNQSLINFVLPIFREVSYLGHEEMQAFAESLTALSKETPAVRMKKKGDALVRYGKLSGAIRAYRQVLGSGEDLAAPFLSQVWHNMGVACMKMLQYEDGLEAFEKSYGLLHTKNTLKSYLFAYALAKPQEKYEEKLHELKVDDGTAKEIALEIAAANEAEVQMPQDMDGALEQMTRSYHNATDA